MSSHFLKIFLLLSMLPFTTDTLHAMTKHEQSAVLSIITQFILTNNKVVFDIPRLTNDVNQTHTKEANVSIEINGEIAAKVFVNGVEVATIGDNAKVSITLDLVEGDNDFNLTLQNASNSMSDSLNITIERIVIDRKGAIKLLRQASFITTDRHIDFIINHGYTRWIEAQLNVIGDVDNNNDTKYGYLESLMRFLHHYDPVRYPVGIITDPYTHLEEYPDSARFLIFSRSIWWEKVLTNEDQLRQRVAYALSQLLVISRSSSVGNSLLFRGEAVATYYDILVKNAFGNYRDLLKEVTMSSAMPYYLTFIGSKKEDNVTGTAPDENYARELMQLFTIGLYELSIDGTKEIGAGGNPTPSYTQDDVSELSKVFTGWDWQTRDPNTRRNRYGDTSYYAHSMTVPIQFTSEYHEYATKNVLGQSISAGLDGEADIDRAIDILMSNSNIAPFVSRHLIMRMVTSNPSPAYIARVATVFNNNGQGVKGDLKATIRAILIDEEARESSSVPHFGKVEEFTLATTHFFSLFNAKPYPFIEYYTYGTRNIRKRFYNTYWFDPTTQYFPQSILNAESVFNFYSPEYVPSDSYFSNNSLVAPEMEIRTINSMIGFSKMLFSLFNYEYYRVIEWQLYNNSNATSIEAWTENAGIDSGGFKNLYLDLTDVYHHFEMLVDGNTNGDFIQLNSIEIGHRDETSQTGSDAIDSLIDYIYMRMIGGTIPSDYKAELKAQLLTIDTQIETNKAETIVRTIIRTITTSPLYMILK